jgi:tetratricopeptide (TPR) repeat protein
VSKPQGRADTKTGPALPFRQAAGLYVQGSPLDPGRIYEVALNANPRDRAAVHSLGIIRLQQGKFSEAESLFRRAVKLQRKSADAYHHLAIALTGLGRLDEAIAHYRKALALRPHDAGAHNNLGYVLQKLDRHDEASRHCRKALAINPEYPEALNNLGNALQSLEQTEAAIEEYRRALTRRPDYAEAHNNLAAALAALNRHEEAIAHCKQALALSPNNAEAHINLANSLGAIEQPEEALAHYNTALAIEPLNAEAYSRASFMLFHLGRIEEAIAYCEKALSIRPDHVGALNNLGVALRATGRIDEAIGYFEKAIVAIPQRAGLYYALANSTRLSESDPHVARMKQMANEMHALKLEDQIGLHFALAKVFADTGDHQRSFQHLLKGNTLKRQQFEGYEERKLLESFERIKTIFDTRLLAEKNGGGNSSKIPIFIVGMPRSGTSLVEQILASHPNIFGAGERYELSKLTDGIVGMDGAEFPEAVAGMTAEQINSLGTQYVRAMLILAPDAKRIVDKMPSNFFSVGLIHLALPNARIIHTRRDPSDTAVSCFSTLFALGHAFSYDLAELGRYYHAYEKLMDHWRRVLPEGTFIDVQYEELVRNLKTESKRIIRFCGMEWDEACLSFHKTERPVRTASVIQVRQPIYASSIGRWRPHETALRPFLRALSEG